jgi:hypothetical protein
MLVNDVIGDVGYDVLKIMLIGKIIKKYTFQITCKILC